MSLCPVSPFLRDSNNSRSSSTSFGHSVSLLCPRKVQHVHPYTLDTQEMPRRARKQAMAAPLGHRDLSFPAGFPQKTYPSGYVTTALLPCPLGLLGSIVWIADKLDMAKVLYGNTITLKEKKKKHNKKKNTTTHGQGRQSQGDLQPRRHGHWGLHRDTKQSKCTQRPRSHTGSVMGMCGQQHQHSAWVGLCVSGYICTTGNETGKHN